MNARNRRIVEARAAGRPVQAIAREEGLSVARVSVIVRDHQKDVRIAELEAEVTFLREARGKVVDELAVFVRRPDIFR